MGKVCAGGWKFRPMSVIPFAYHSLSGDIFKQLLLLAREQSRDRFTFALEVDALKLAACLLSLLPSKLNSKAAWSSTNKPFQQNSSTIPRTLSCTVPQKKTQSTIIRHGTQSCQHRSVLANGSHGQ